MARVVENTDLRNRERRLRLEPRKKPYWMSLSEGEHLGYYRGKLVGKWVARYRRAGTVGPYQETTLTQADDFMESDGQSVINFKEAQDAARLWFAMIERNGGKSVGKYIRLICKRPPLI